MRRSHLKLAAKEHAWTFAVWGVALLLGCLGYAGFSGKKPYSWDVIYQAVQLFVLEASFQKDDEVGSLLQFARFFAPFVAIATVVRAVGHFFGEQLRQRFPGDYVIVCGLGNRGKRIADAVLQRGERLIVIESDQTNPAASQYREQGVQVLWGDASDLTILSSAGIRQAKMLILVCRDEEVNAEIALSVSRFLKGRRGKAITCIAHVTNLRLQKTVQGEIEPAHFKLLFFDMFDLGARILLSEYSPFGRAGEQPSSINLLVIGTGPLTARVVLDAARTWQVLRSGSGEKLPITIADFGADSWVHSIGQEYPVINELCALAPLSMNPDKPDFTREQLANVTNAYVLFSKDEQSQRMVHFLSDLVGDRNLSIVARVEQRRELSLALERQRGKAAVARVSFVALLERALTLDQLLGDPIELLARAIHQDYVFQQTRKGVNPESTASLLPWDRLSDDFKESNRQQAAHINTKLKAIDCTTAPLQMPDEDLVQLTPQETELLAKLEHERFVTEREKRGWTYGPNKDLKYKTSPYLAPWENLEEKIKDLDRNVIHHLPILLASQGVKIKRLE